MMYDFRLKIFLARARHKVLSFDAIPMRHSPTPIPT